MAEKSRLSLPVRRALSGSRAVITAFVFFLTVCLCSAATVRPMAMLLTLLALSAAFLFYERLRDRLKIPMLVLAAMVLMDLISCSYALSKKFALYEILKVMTAFCLTLLLLAFVGGEKPERKLAGILEGFSAIAGLVSIDLLSTRLISGPVLTVLGWFTTDYMNLDMVEEGVRMTSVLIYPNTFATCMGIGVLLSLGLAVSSERRGQRAVHLVCLSVSSLSFVLAFSLGASAMIVPAFLAFLALTGKTQRTGLFILMVETLLVTILTAFPISITSMTAWTGFRPVPLLCAIGGAGALCALDLLAGLRLAEKLKSHGKAVLAFTAALAAALVLFLIAACTLTTGATLQPGESLRRSAYPAPGNYTLTVQTDGNPNVIVQSQNRGNTMMHTYLELYRGPASGASFIVPEDSVVIWFTFSAEAESRLESAEYAGESGSGKLPLRYRLLPGFVANRLQGLRTNQNAIQRFVFFEDGLKLFRRSPVIGLGLGAYANSVNGIQSFYYVTKYAHSHYIQTLTEQGIIGFLLFLGFLATGAIAVWRGRKKPLAPALGAAVVFVICHSAVEGTLTQYASLPMVFGLFATVSLCCGEDIPLPAWMEKRVVKNGLALGVCALLALFGVLLGCNIAARGLVTDPSDLDQLEQAAALDPFEKADYLLTYVIQAGSQEADGEVREKADEYAARLAKLDSNSIPIYLAEYYLQTGRTEQGLEQAERYVSYVSADAAVWQRTFDLLEEYEQDTDAYRAGVSRIADLLDAWNAENLGRIELDEQAQAFIDRTRT